MCLKTEHEGGAPKMQGSLQARTLGREARGLSHFCVLLREG